ncbi:hypothetical protein EW145_g796 [Phellinidium pouzarii]|uniref:Uncharacterized protein n=1 Tax=Phellinidium pouzarii TaxID=167371 RepID=A0A4S4LGX7_9AGAM|nr:hypothetical protein EW145_g796 [Phellinidium pouzarii]
MAEFVNPLHPEIIPRLDPEFVAYYNAHLATQLGAHQIPWDPAIRSKQPIAGFSDPLEVGLIKDIPLTKCAMRVFWPEAPSKVPAVGFPILIYFHGGGWTLGNIATENHFSTIMCMKANCVVASVDYRLGPEQPYPAAVEDAVEALHWILEHGKSELGVDVSRIAVGGSSSGANLAAVVTHKAALSEPPISLSFQLLVVPVVDNTASALGQPYASWHENRYTPSLSPARMLWFRDKYLPNVEDRAKWDNSPMFAPEELFQRAPDAWIAVAELDILRDEGLAYGRKLEKAGRSVELKVYKGSPHPILAMDVRARGVYGGQVISQAVVSATTCVDPSYGLHSLHCYFLLSASPSLPVLYYVDRLRDGRSYATRFVRAVQRGKVVFIMMCSFHRPEPAHPFHQFSMPSDIPKPEDLETDVDVYRRRLLSIGSDEKMKIILEGLVQERSRSPILCTVQVERKAADGTLIVMSYMKARGIPKYGPAFQKCILGYMSDMSFIVVASKSLGLDPYGKGPGALGMSSSLDHAIFFYSDEFDCSNWILYVKQSPRTGSGRGVVQGQMYARDGTLVAITTQEGVIRSDIDRSENPSPTKSRL